MTMAPVLGPIGNLGDHARLYAQAGVEVFPVNPRDKTPLVSQYRATTDVEVVAEWWSTWPGALIGHRIAADQIVLDIDPRHGGDVVWRALWAEVGYLPVTRGHMSGRGDGGGHTWWVNPGIRLSVSKLNEWARERGLGHALDGDRWTAGIDILHRDHRYTILPPSPHPESGEPYRWIDGRGLDVEPGVLASLVADLITDDTLPPPPRDPQPRDPSSIADWYSDTQRWSDLLSSHGWTLRAGDGDADGSRWRHSSATSAYSATIRHECLFVYSPNTAFEVTAPSSPHGYTLFAAFAVLDHGGDQSAAAAAARELKDGPVSHDDLTWMPQEAPAPPPVSPPEDVPEAAESPAQRLRAAVLSTASIMSLTPPEPLIAGFLNRNSIATLYGPSGGGKTFLALDWALHVATASYWHGKAIHAVNVLYVIAEGASGIGSRLTAWAEHHGNYQLSDTAAIHWLPQAVNLGSADDVEALRAVLTELDVGFVVLDTLARCTVGVEENSARDMGVVVANLDRLRRATGACILTVHHTGKDVTSGARGSSALRAAMDTEIEVIGDDLLGVKVTKQKDGAEPPPRWLAKVPVARSLVLVPAEQAPERDDLPASGWQAFEALRDLAVPEGVTKAEWQMAVTGMPERTFFRARTQLVKVGLVDNCGTAARPRYRVADEAVVAGFGRSDGRSEDE